MIVVAFTGSFNDMSYGETIVEKKNRIVNRMQKAFPHRVGWGETRKTKSSPTSTVPIEQIWGKVLNERVSCHFINSRLTMRDDKQTALLNIKLETRYSGHVFGAEDLKGVVHKDLIKIRLRQIGDTCVVTNLAIRRTGREKGSVSLGQSEISTYPYVYGRKKRISKKELEPYQASKASAESQLRLGELIMEFNKVNDDVLACQHEKQQQLLIPKVRELGARIQAEIALATSFTAPASGLRELVQNKSVKGSPHFLKTVQRVVGSVKDRSVDFRRIAR